MNREAVGDVVEAEGITATDFPRRRSEEEYARAVSRYAERVSSQEGVLGIYQIGSVGTPGVSDIDLVVLVEENTRALRPAAFDIAELDADTRYLFMHRPFIVNQRAAPSLHLHYRIEQIRSVWGSIAPAAAFIDHPDAVSPAHVQVAVTVDFGVDLAAQLLHALVTRRLAVRGMLCLLLSLRHTIAGARSVGLPLSPKHEAFERQVLQLRAECFGLGTRDLAVETMKLVREGAEVALEILGDLCTRVLAQDEYFGRFVRELPLTVRSPVLALAQKHYAVFTAPYNGQEAVSRALVASRDSTFRFSPSRIANRLLLFLPRTLYYQFAAYASQGGNIGRQIAARMHPRVTVPAAVPRSAYGEMLRARTALANVQAQFLSRHGFEFGQLLLNGFITPPRHGGVVRRAVERLQVRILQRTRFDE